MLAALRPALGTVVFLMFALAGPVVGVPWVVAGRWVEPPLLGGEPSRWFGVLLFLAGLPIWVDAAVGFVRQGHGTPAPVAPPERLVVAGPYQYVRNPMYVGVLAMIFGQALFLGSRAVLMYGVGVALAAHLFVVLYEEPTLRKRFGAEYIEYCRQVHRWLPRWPASRVY